MPFDQYATNEVTRAAIDDLNNLGFKEEFGFEVCLLACFFNISVSFFSLISSATIPSLVVLCVFLLDESGSPPNNESERHSNPDCF